MAKMIHNPVVVELNPNAIHHSDAKKPFRRRNILRNGGTRQQVELRMQQLKQLEVILNKMEVGKRDTYVMRTQSGPFNEIETVKLHRKDLIAKRNRLITEIKTYRGLQPLDPLDRATLKRQREVEDLGGGGPLKKARTLPIHGVKGKARTTLKKAMSFCLETLDDPELIGIPAGGVKGPLSAENIDMQLDRFMKKIKSAKDNMKPWDKENLTNPRRIDYIDEMMATLFRRETEMIEVTDIDPNYFATKQMDIRPRMRVILFTWLLEVHNKFKLQECVLWTSWSLIDRFLSKEAIRRQKFQLLGCTAMWVACKYHEIYPPIIKDFVYIADGAFNADFLLTFEMKLVHALGYIIHNPTVIDFLPRFTEVATHHIVERKKIRIKFLALYTAERSQVTFKLASLKPSKYAAACLCCAMMMTGEKWNPGVEKESGYSQKSLKNILKVLKSIVLDFTNSEHKAIIKKYSSEKRGKVALLRLKPVHSKHQRKRDKKG